MNTSDIRQSLYQCLIQEVAVDSSKKYIDLFAIAPGKSFRINLYIETEEAQPDIIGITFASGTSPIIVGENLIQNVPFFKVIQANINDDSGSSNYNFYYYDAGDSLRHYYLSLPENYSGIVLIRKEIQYGEIDQLLSVSTSSIDISNLIINLTSESLEISNGRFVEADDITFVNGLLGKDENAFIGSADNPFSAIYGNLKGTAESATKLANKIKIVSGNSKVNLSSNEIDASDEENQALKLTISEINSDLLTGNIAYDRIANLVGTTANSIAEGNHNHDGTYIGYGKTIVLPETSDLKFNNNASSYTIVSENPITLDLKLKDNTVSSSILQDNSITTEKISDGSVTVDKIASGDYSSKITLVQKASSADSATSATTASKVSNKLSISVTNKQNPADDKTIGYDGSEELLLELIFQPLRSEDIDELGIFTKN